MSLEIFTGDCRVVLAGVEPDSFDACVTDPPYHLTELKPRVGRGFGLTMQHGRTAEQKAARAGFMGKTWDGGDVAFRPETWAAVLRVLKPGAHLLAFGGTRTYHRLACAIEDAGFEIRDCVMWLYGSGFPKSHDVSKALDRAAGAEREVIGHRTDGRYAYDFSPQASRSGGIMGEDAGSGRPAANITAPATEAARARAGWGTALKPATEIVCVARKPSAAVSSAELHGLTGWDHWCSAKADGEDKIVTARALHPAARSYRARIDKAGQEVAREDLGGYEPFAVDAVAANCLKWGTGALNIDASRIGTSTRLNASAPRAERNGFIKGFVTGTESVDLDHGRWPANVCHDGSPEVLAAFARFGDAGGGYGQQHPRHDGAAWADGSRFKNNGREFGFGDTGTGARFYFCPKADASERVGSHPTVKPVALMEWLVQMVTPPGGRVLDPFCGTGSTLVACDRLGLEAVGIEQDARTVADAEEKIRRMRARRLIGDVAERAQPVAGQLEMPL